MVNKEKMSLLKYANSNLSCNIDTCVRVPIGAYIGGVF